MRLNEELLPEEHLGGQVDVGIVERFPVRGEVLLQPSAAFGQNHLGAPALHDGVRDTSAEVPPHGVALPRARQQGTHCVQARVASHRALQRNERHVHKENGVRKSYDRVIRLLKV